MNPIDRYILDNSTNEDALMVELDRETNLRAMSPRMISGHLQGSFLRLLAQVMNAHGVLEIGTFTGYSTLSLAAGVEEGGFVDTIEVNDELEDLARSFFERSCHGHKIRQHIGSALEIAATLNRGYDLVFIDGDKREYPGYWRMLMGDGEFAEHEPMVHSGSIILADNILWYDKVIHEISNNDHQTQAIVEFNKMVKNDPRVENIILPIRDGLNLIRVK